MQEQRTSVTTMWRWSSAALLAAALAVAGCHSSSNPNGADPADVNAAQAAPNCANGQVLLSDGACGSPQQGATQQGGATPQNESVAGNPAAAPAGAAPTQRRPAYSSGQTEPSSGQAEAPAYPQSNGSYADQQAAPAYPQQNESYGQQAPPEDNSGDYAQNNPYDDQTYQQDAYNDGYQQGYDQGIEANQPPPPLPVYAQPACPGDGYLWTPGYWNYASAGYYWVPGVWARAPYTGALWTPGWWGVAGALFRWHTGYWGPHIGFYGGVPYGYGYTGSGFHGGYWDRDRFMYNRSVTNVNVTNIRNVYNRTVINNYTVNNRVSYNGRGGIATRPTPAEFAAMREQHVRPLPAQIQHSQQAMQDRAQYAHVNQGRPANVAVARPLELQRINVAQHLINPGVRGETRPTPALRPAVVAQPRPLAPNANQPRPVQPQRTAQPVNTAPERGGVRPTVPAANGHPQPAPTPNRPGVAVRPPANNAPVNRSPAAVNRPVIQQPRSQPQHTQPQPVRQQQEQAQPRPQPVQRAQPQHVQPQPQPQRVQPQPQHVEQQPRPQPQPQPQHVEQQPRPQPQPQHVEQPRPQPEPQHVEQPRPEPQHQEAQPQHQEAPHQEAPRPAEHPRP